MIWSVIDQVTPEDLEYGYFLDLAFLLGESDTGLGSIQVKYTSYASDQQKHKYNLYIDGHDRDKAIKIMKYLFNT